MYRIWNKKKEEVWENRGIFKKDESYYFYIL